MRRHTLDATARLAALAALVLLSLLTACAGSVADRELNAHTQPAEVEAAELAGLVSVARQDTMAVHGDSSLVRCYLRDRSYGNAPASALSCVAVPFPHVIGGGASEARAAGELRP